jgi:hypothetical protein
VQPNSIAAGSCHLLAVRRPGEGKDSLTGVQGTETPARARIVYPVHGALSRKSSDNDLLTVRRGDTYFPPEYFDPIWISELARKQFRAGLRE